MGRRHRNEGGKKKKKGHSYTKFRTEYIKKEGTRNNIKSKEALI